MVDEAAPPFDVDPADYEVKADDASVGPRTQRVCVYVYVRACVCTCARVRV